MGFAFSLIDLTPAERLVWADKTPGPIEPPPGGRFPPAVRDRLGGEPITVPSGNWPAGTTLKRAPDACWRLDLVRDERPEVQRADFTRAVAMPGFDNTKIEESYSRIAAKHAEHLLTEKLRFTRGAIYRSNVGLVRFEGTAPTRRLSRPLQPPAGRRRRPADRRARVRWRPSASSVPNCASTLMFQFAVRVRPAASSLSSRS